MDRAFNNERVYLQNKEMVNVCTGGGPVGEPPMLKSDFCSLNQSINFQSIEVGKRVSLTSLIRSRLGRSCSSFLWSSYVKVRSVVNPTSTGTTASLLYVIRNGVSLVGILTVVL